jgi:hypothetical protein
MMDEIDVEGEPIFQYIERIIKNDTNRALFSESNNDLYMMIMDDIEGWMARK